MCLPLLNPDVGKYVTSRRVIEKNISDKTIDLFRRMLLFICESETIIDNMRRVIFKSQTKFEPFYRALNSERSGRITISELESQLRKYNQQLSQYQTPVLFYRMCQNKSTYLTFDAFERFCSGGEISKQSQQPIYQLSSFPIQSSNQINQYHHNFYVKPKISDFKIIINKLIGCVNLEVDIESIQKYLITKRDLRLHNLFGMFRPNRNLVDVYTFTETLKNIFKIPLVDQGDVSLLFRKIKNSNTQRDLIDFAEFCNVIIPKEEQPPRNLFDRDRAGDLEFYAETFTFLQKLFKAHLNNEVIFNEVRFEIQMKYINLYDLFDFFCSGRQYLERADFDRVLKENGSQHPSLYHNLLFARFDPKKEGIINFNYFSHALVV